MSHHSPIPSPPPELIEQWREETPAHFGFFKREAYLATRAARWGADQELEAFQTWLACKGYLSLASDLLAARRPKPPSLKEQALKMLRPLSSPVMLGTPEYRLYEPQVEIIRRALEALDD